MKTISQLLSLSLLGGSLLVNSARADVTNITVTPPVVTLPPVPPSGSVIDPKALPQEIKQLEQKFETDREVYLAREKTLADKLKNASDDQRAKILEAMKDQRQKWLDQSRALREDIRDHIKDLQQEISEKKQAVLNASAEKNRGHGK